MDTNENDYELQLPGDAPDKVNSLIALVLGSHVPSCPVRLLDRKTPDILAAFDAELHGKGLGYGDGKPARNHVKNWKDETQWLSWNLRLNAPAHYDVYLDYNTAMASDSGTVIVKIGDRIFETAYYGHPEKNGTKSIYVGTVSLDKGQFDCTLKGKNHTGATYMNPIALRLQPK